ncbi:MAG: AAA family ATPase, partial [Candidatus Margulisiibacteriota bacterium]
MIKRNLNITCFSTDFGSQMRFIAGPRQAGKTTLAQSFLEELFQENLYFNWDFRETRLAYQQDTDYYLHALLNVGSAKNYWFCFDEIHKYPKWKDILKEVYDKYGQQYHFIITGSARLDLFRKSGDSLAGRYFLFKLFPLVLNELTNINKPQADNLSSGWKFIEKRISSAKYLQNDMENLLKFSGFPDPFLAQKENFHNKWKTTYLDRLIQEDLREISQVADLENVSQLIMLLPD